MSTTPGARLAPFTASGLAQSGATKDFLEQIRKVLATKPFR